MINSLNASYSYSLTDHVYYLFYQVNVKMGDTSPYILLQSKE
jgi:hypothetical protein